MEKVELLGHYVDKNGVHTDEQKVEKILNAPRPTTRKELRSFLGLASYYRRFIPGFAKLARPLHEKTSDRVKLEWTDEMSKSFHDIKTALCSPPVLAYPDYDAPFIVSTDASDKALGAVLSQKDKDGRNHPIHYASRCLSATEEKYSTVEREALAVIFALKKFRPYLLTSRFTLFTDHQALKYTFNKRDPHGRIARWFSFLAEFQFDIMYKPGQENVPADFLSRNVSASDLVASMKLEPASENIARYLETLETPAEVN